VIAETLLRDVGKKRYVAANVAGKSLVMTKCRDDEKAL
jgi:hypothetical protein